jgi:hypothetical protein
MAYIGNTPAEAYISISSQTFTTINGTDYTLSSSVESSEDIALFLNNVRQKPSTYTATGTALTMGTATTTADELYCVYLGKALQTVNPGAGSVGTAQIADLAVTSAKLAGDAVTTAKVLDSNVTYAKIQDTTTANRVIGAATAGVVSEVQVATDMVADEAITTPKANFISTSSGAGVISKGTSGDSDGYLQLNCSENSHGVKIKSPAHSAAQSYTLTLPGAAPAVNKFIETDGSGNLSFSSVDVTTDITGTVPTANLGTGTASASTVLYGDQTYKTAPSGDCVRLATVADAGSGTPSSIDIDSVFSSTYNFYKLYARNIEFSGTGYPSIQFLISGTAQSAGDYKSKQIFLYGNQSTASEQNTTESANTGFRPTGSWVQNTGDQYGCNFEMTFFMPFDDSTVNEMYALSNINQGTGQMISGIAQGFYDSTIEATGIRLNASAGTWAKGIFNLYGFKAS